MKYLKRFNESFNIEEFDVEKEEIKEWLGDFFDEFPQLDLDIYDWSSLDNSAAFNIIISYDNTLEGPVITESKFPIKSHLPFLDDRLKERGLKVSYYDYSSLDIWSILKIGISKISLNESSDPKVGTGKKPKGSNRRLYTDENPKDTVPVKFRTKEDIVDTLNSSSFKSKTHKRQSQIINLIEQRLRVALERAKEEETKKRLKRAYDYIKIKCQKSKEKTKKLQESGNASFDWLIKQKNESYFELTEILQGELFDDFDILPRKDEEFTDGDHLTNPFWSYTVGPYNNFTSKAEEVGEKEIDRIVAFNIKHKDYTEFKQRLIELKERAENFIGREIILGEEALGAPPEPHPELDYWDFIIKIGKMI